jgi:PiT family inorganic phosphate transporter
MGKRRRVLEKPTLDKDLKKFTTLEEAGLYVSRGLARPAAGLIIIIMAALLAGMIVGEDPGGVAIIAGSTLGAYMAMNIGANDVTNNVGPAVGAKAMTMAQALVIGAFFDAAGALIAGGDVVRTVSGGIVNIDLVPSPAAFVLVMLAGLLAAAIWVNFATWIGAPVSTTHAIVGGVLGGGIASAGFKAVSWSSLREITASWIASPIIGGLIAILFLAFIKEFIIYREDKIASAKRWVPVLVAIMSGAFASYLAIKGLENVAHLSIGQAFLLGVAIGVCAWLVTRPMIARQADGLENKNESLRLLFRVPLIFSAALLSFAHGANDVSNAIGPLSAIVSVATSAKIGGVAEIPFWVMMIGACGIAAGILLFGPRLIRLVGGEITKLNPMRAFCVALSTAVTVIIASWLGLPVSTTHIAVGGVFGVGFYREWYTRNSKRRMQYIQMKAAGSEIVRDAPKSSPEEMRRRYLVRRSHFMTIVAAWIITVPVSALLAAGIYEILAYLSFQG